MKILKSLSVLLILVLLASCGSKTSKKENPAETSVSGTAQDLKTGKQKYGIKSGIVEYTSTVMGMDVKQILYFDDFGAKEVNEMVMDMVGMKITTVSLLKDGYMYSYNPVEKTGTKVSISGSGNANIDFKNLSKEMEKKMNLKKIGKETFAGKTCDKYSIDYVEMSMTGTFLVWEGIALKTDAKVSSMEMKMTAKSIKENADIPAEKFEVPSDIQFSQQ